MTGGFRDQYRFFYSCFFYIVFFFFETAGCCYRGLRESPVTVAVFIVSIFKAQTVFYIEIPQ